MSVYCLLPAEGRGCINTALTDLQLALVKVDDVRVAVRDETLCTPLTANTTLLVATEHAMDTVSIMMQRWWLVGLLTLGEWASRTS